MCIPLNFQATPMSKHNLRLFLPILFIIGQLLLFVLRWLWSKYEEQPSMLSLQGNLIALVILISFALILPVRDKTIQLNLSIMFLTYCIPYIILLGLFWRLFYWKMPKVSYRVLPLLLLPIYGTYAHLILVELDFLILVVGLYLLLLVFVTLYIEVDLKTRVKNQRTHYPFHWLRAASSFLVIPLLCFVFALRAIYFESTMTHSKQFELSAQVAIFFALFGPIIIQLTFHLLGLSWWYGWKRLPCRNSDISRRFFVFFCLGTIVGLVFVSFSTNLHPVTGPWVSLIARMVTGALITGFIYSIICTRLGNWNKFPTVITIGSVASTLAPYSLDIIYFINILYVAFLLARAQVEQHSSLRPWRRLVLHISIWSTFACCYISLPGSFAYLNSSKTLFLWIIGVFLGLIILQKCMNFFVTQRKISLYICTRIEKFSILNIRKRRGA